MSKTLFPQKSILQKIPPKYLKLCFVAGLHAQGHSSQFIGGTEPTPPAGFKTRPRQALRGRLRWDAPGTDLKQQTRPEQTGEQTPTPQRSDPTPSSLLSKPNSWSTVEARALCVPCGST